MMPPEPSQGADPWHAGVPVTTATVAGRYCSALADRLLNELNLSALRAHPGLTLDAQPDVTWPAVLARVLSSDGKPIGTLARLLSSEEPHDRVPLLKPVRWWGERCGGAALIMPASKPKRRWRDVVTLATTFDMAISLMGLRHPSQHWVVDGLDHLAECDLPAGGRIVIVVPPGAEAQLDSRMLMDLAVKRLLRDRAATAVKLKVWPPAAKAAAA
jgi:hypothetical protein